MSGIFRTVWQPYTTIGLFADDSSLTRSNKSKTLLENHMNDALNKVDEWLKTNKLSLNYNKTEFLEVNKSNSKCGTLNIRIGMNCIAQVKHVIIILRNNN